LEMGKFRQWQRSHGKHLIAKEKNNAHTHDQA
jgi:hypothetical protein